MHNTYTLIIIITCGHNHIARRMAGKLSNNGPSRVCYGSRVCLGGTKYGPMGDQISRGGQSGGGGRFPGRGRRQRAPPGTHALMI
jgi:hypothetical protein